VCVSVIFLSASIAAEKLMTVLFVGSSDHSAGITVNVETLMRLAQRAVAIRAKAARVNALIWCVAG
jgi:hypothetical protein